MKNDACNEWNTCSDWVHRLAIYLALGLAPVFWIAAVNWTLAPGECWANDLEGKLGWWWQAAIFGWGCFSLWIMINWRRCPCRE